ncbi:cytochrome C oxidase subunit IV family protein [Pseudomaricurvus alcaniphilus]|uniref:cytochrome C oxidase subunit IV family protein n=1 Tax=Pseudomaricurvus alcaniphilus TaxID=1166482 RepID=UPI0014091658|nr:cytochrome C oxidase subunit IV family protein [Pseudomaricurvus alcaniphilus]NHN37828.1 cytochrome C oxidase subunit IV family protein [Pseudomaricurvus alcaniphilus]
MYKLIKSRETMVWLLLMVITGASWMLGANHSILFTEPAKEAAVLLLLAFFKVRLVIRYFMEVRHASILIKLASEAWLIVSCVAIVALSFGVSSS